MRFGHRAWCGQTAEYRALRRVQGLMAHPGGCADKVKKGRMRQVVLPGTRTLMMKRFG